ncbi:MAG: hypothetical protein IJJ23_12120 [Clostridia bacterium]|nr:hypothetical protein [Clostridia bacterium]
MKRIIGTILIALLLTASLVVFPKPIALTGAAAETIEERLRNELTSSYARAKQSL